MRFFKIVLYVSIILTPLAVFLEKFENSNAQSSFVSAFNLLLMPGFMIYVLVTGDIHGWKPGPIGVGGRIAVTMVGSTIFWSSLIFLATRNRYKQ